MYIDINLDNYKGFLATSSQYAVLIYHPAIFNSQHTNIAITECIITPQKNSWDVIIPPYHKSNGG